MRGRLGLSGIFSSQNESAFSINNGRIQFCTAQACDRSIRAPTKPRHSSILAAPNLRATSAGPPCRGRQSRTKACVRPDVSSTLFHASQVAVDRSRRDAVELFCSHLVHKLCFSRRARSSPRLETLACRFRPVVSGERFAVHGDLSYGLLRSIPASVRRHPLVPELRLPVSQHQLSVSQALF